MLRPLRRELLDRAYDVFARYRSHRITGCECCTSPEFLAELNAHPRALSPDSAFGFGISVMATVGNETSFKRLEERTLESVSVSARQHPVDRDRHERVT